MRYKVGDLVRVRTDLIVGETYYNDDRGARDSFVGEMKLYAGEVVRVRIADKKYYMETTDGKNISWCWTDGMLEDVTENPEIVLVTT